MNGDIFLSKKILVVEDEVDFCEIVSQNIELLFGFTVVRAHDGVEGLKTFQESDFDLVITDIRMPKKNGVELFHSIRALKPNTPVLMITGFADFHHSELLAMGVTGVLQKPIDLKVINDKIEEILKVKPLS